MFCVGRPECQGGTSHHRPPYDSEKGKRVSTQRSGRSRSQSPSLVGEEFGDTVDEKSGEDVRSDFAGNVYLRIAVRRKQGDFELVVRRPDERADVAEVLMGRGNWCNHGGRRGIAQSRT